MEIDSVRSVNNVNEVYLVPDNENGAFTSLDTMFNDDQ